MIFALKVDWNPIIQQSVPYLLPVALAIIGYVAGWFRDRFRLPKPLQVLLGNAEAKKLAEDWIYAAGQMEQMTKPEKREYVKRALAGELQRLLGEKFPSVIINAFIEIMLGKLMDKGRLPGTPPGG